MSNKDDLKQLLNEYKTFVGDEDAGLGSLDALKKNKDELKAKKQMAEKYRKILEDTGEVTERHISTSFSLKLYHVDFINELNKITGISKSAFVRGLIDMAIQNMSI